MKKKQPNAEVRRHWHRLSFDIGCVISGETPATIHHAHGGSMVFRGIHTGMGQKTSDWLVIPLAARFHVGDFGIDNGMGKFKGVKAWEKNFGNQADFLDIICQQIGVDLWRKAEDEM